jgi:hypothetical protein
MFDRKRLERFLDGLQVEIHFPSVVPQKVIPAPPRTALDAKMDRYDILKQGQEDYANVSTPEYPVLARRADDNPFNNLMYMPMQWGWGTYASISRPGSAYITGTDVSVFDPDEQAHPRETPFDRLKGKMVRLAASESIQFPDPVPLAPARSPDFVHTLTAWRGWEVSHGMLEALGSDSKWEPKRAPRANCRSGHHPAPDMHCYCGYWSFKSLDLLTAAMETYACSVDVVGQVEIWGRVIECENGWRSEFAYPKELWLLDEGLEGLSWKYGVPVRKLG